MRLETAGRVVHLAGKRVPLKEFAPRIRAGNQPDGFNVLLLICKLDVGNWRSLHGDRKWVF